MPFETRKMKTKKRILEISTRLIHTKGFHSTSVGDIISEAGIKKGGVYHYFMSKEQIGLEVLAGVGQKFMEFLDDVLAGDHHGKAIENFLDLVLKNHQETGFVGGCFFGNMALEMADDNNNLKEATSMIFSAWIKKLENVVLAAQEDSQIRNDIPARSLAQQIVMTIEGGIMISRLTKNEMPLKECIELLKKFLQLY
jgi:TetR/AcrR family transcriptional regulator, transcriptional repressor for nem operon